MSANPDPPANAAADETAEHIPTPDEDGPHDVPDDKVIEKTLPAKPPTDRDPA